MVFTLIEIVEIAITTLLIGYIFSGFIRKPMSPLDKILGLGRKKKLFDWGDLKYAAMITAPAIILHELGHKFAGIAFGVPAFYHGVLTGGSTIVVMNIFAIILRVISAGFIFFVPGYVAVEQSVDAITMGWIAFAGPAVNLALWFISKRMLESGKYRAWHRELAISKMINMWLFIFNMLPFGPLDGAKVFRGLMVAFGG